MYGKAENIYCGRDPWYCVCIGVSSHQYSLLNLRPTSAALIVLWRGMWRSGGQWKLVMLSNNVPINDSNNNVVHCGSIVQPQSGNRGCIMAQWPIWPSHGKHLCGVTPVIVVIVVGLLVYLLWPVCIVTCCGSVNRVCVLYCNNDNENIGGQRNKPHYLACIVALFWTSSAIFHVLTWA